MKFLFPLIAALAIFFPIPTYGVLYVGVFYNLALKATLKSRFYSTNIIGTADNSSRVEAYDHITLHFKPNQTMLSNVYNARFGEIHQAHVLGYAMDEHGQAILVKVDGGPNAIQSTNTFPHVTISSSNSPGYSAVYSNDLWARVAASGFVLITNDRYNKPSEIFWNSKNPAFKQAKFISEDTSSSTYQFPLPAFTGEFGTYTPTQAKVTLYKPSIRGLLKGTFCADNQWNRNTGVCDPTPIGPTSVFRTLSFTLQLNGRTTSDVGTVIYLADAMRIVADAAGIPNSDYVINNGHIIRDTGRENSRNGKWRIKIGFRVLADGQDQRKTFEKKLKEMCYKPKGVTYNAAGESLGLVMDDEDAQSIIYANEMYTTQTCADQTTLSAEQLCAASAATSIESSIMTSSSSSSSIPIATIVAPIIGGIVLIALIATIIIIRRRRTNNAVKSMEGVARNTNTAALELNTATPTDRV